MAGVARLGVGIELVGRAAELAALTGALDAAVAGRPSGVLLGGDAGVGKSRLLAEAADRAAAAGCAVLVGRCLDTAESALPYLPFTEIIGRLADTRPELVERHPALRHLLPGQQTRAEQGGQDRVLGQVRVFDAVLSVLDELAADTPALVVLEDLHWADRSSRDLLVFLLSRLSRQRLVLVTSYRTDDLHRRHPLRPVLAELVRLPAVERVELRPLDPDTTLALVRRLADGRLPEPALHRAARRSEGNAFFAEELVSAGADGMPHELAELLVARVEGMAADTQRVLRVAAVAGRRVRHGRLAAVSGLDIDALEQALRDAVAGHVLVAVPGTATEEDGYAFRHALLREAVYHELLPGERSRIHAGYAALLAGPAGGAEPGRAAELAHHALAGHDLPLALAASVRAAGEADEREAPAELLLHAERALELWAAVPDAEAVSGSDEITVTRWAAWGASATGDPDRGIALGRRALWLAERRADPELSSLLGRLYALRLLDLGGREREALEAARRSLTLIADGPPTGELAWAHAVLARVLGRLDRFTEAVAEAEAARAVAERAPPADPSALDASADALVTLAVCHEYGGRPELARRQLDEATALAQRAGNLGVELRAYYAVGISLLDDGRLRAAGDQLAAGARRADATGTTWSGTAWTCGSGWPRRASCTATGTPRWPRPSWPASRCRSPSRPGWRRWGCWWPPAAVGSTPSTGGSPNCGRPTRWTTRSSCSSGSRPPRRRSGGSARPPRWSTCTRRWPGCAGRRAAAPRPTWARSCWRRWAWPPMPTWCSPARSRARTRWRPLASWRPRPSTPRHTGCRAAARWGRRAGRGCAVPAPSCRGSPAPTRAPGRRCSTPSATRSTRAPSRRTSRAPRRAPTARTPSATGRRTPCCAGRRPGCSATRSGRGIADGSRPTCGRRRWPPTGSARPRWRARCAPSPSGPACSSRRIATGSGSRTATGGAPSPGGRRPATERTGRAARPLAIRRAAR